MQDCRIVKSAGFHHGISWDRSTISSPKLSQGLVWFGWQPRVGCAAAEYSGERCPRPGYYPLPGPVPVSLTFSRGHRCHGCCPRPPRQTRHHRPVQRPVLSLLRNHFVTGWVPSIAPNPARIFIFVLILGTLFFCILLFRQNFCSKTRLAIVLWAMAIAVFPLEIHQKMFSLYFNFQLVVIGPARGSEPWFGRRAISIHEPNSVNHLPHIPRVYPKMPPCAMKTELRYL